MILEIAAGIVLAVIFICYLPIIITLAFIGLCIGVLVVTGMLLHDIDMLVPVSVAFVVVYIAGVIWGYAASFVRGYRGS